jgi:hypothetical protein
MNIGRYFMHALKVQLASDSLGSIQALYQEIMNSLQQTRLPNAGGVIEHRSLSVWSEEFQAFLGDTDPRLITNLTALFDSPKRWSYSTIARSVEDLSNCWLNIFGGITPSLLQENLTQASTGGGLISRIIFVVGYGREMKCPVPFLSAEDRKLQKMLLEDLAEIKTMSGPFLPTEKYVEEYTKWYMSPDETLGADSDKFVGYNSRRALHLRKLCMLLSASCDNKMTLTTHNLERAHHILKFTEREMPNAFFGIGRGQHAKTMMDIVRFVGDGGTVAKKDIIRRFQLDAMPLELESYIDALSVNGSIRCHLGQGNKMMVSPIKKTLSTKTIEVMNKTVFSKMNIKL